MEAEQEQTSMFFSQLFDKQLSRQRAMLDSFIVSYAAGVLRSSSNPVVGPDAGH
jgi:hypothetical protein